MIYGYFGDYGPARGGLVWGQMTGCYLKSGGLHLPRGSV